MLFALALQANDNGKGLNWAFAKTADECNRSVNSVRNYYYAQTKMFELVPALANDLGITLINSNRGDFTLFSATEIDNLIKTVLKNKACGISVRSTIAQLSNGDTKLALRLQNKFRSMVANHKKRVMAIMQELQVANQLYYNPYSKKISTECEIDNHKKLVDFVANLDETEAEKFLDLMQKVFA